MVAVSPAGDIFASAEGHALYDDTTQTSTRLGQAQIRIWNARTGEELRRMPMADDVDSVAFSPDGIHLAARMTKTVVVFKVKDWSEARRFEFSGELARGGTVGFVPGGRRIVAEAAEGVQVWALDGTTSRLLRHGSNWPHYTVSSDGRLLATLSRSLLRIWDVDTGTALFELQFPELQYTDIAFVGVDNDLIARTEAGLVRVLWKTGSMISQACSRFARNITPEEWRKFFDDELPARTCSDSSGFSGAAAQAHTGSHPR
jgi:WD40 repeat protein